MSTLNEYLTELAELLSDEEVPAFDYIPERFTPAAVLVLPGTPYVEPGETFGEHQANFEIWLVAPQGTNKVVTDFLNNSLQKNIPVLLENGYAVEGVDEPFIFQPGNAQYLTVVLRVSTAIRFT